MILTPDAPARVLLIEDDPDDVLMTCRAFERNRMPVEVEVVRDGAEAVARLTGAASPGGKELPHLVLLDLNLPRKNGREVLQTIRATFALKRLPVVVFTTSIARADVNFCYEQHANSYVVKPEGPRAYDAFVNRLSDFWFKVAELPDDVGSNA